LKGIFCSFDGEIAISYSIIIHGKIVVIFIKGHRMGLFDFFKKSPVKRSDMVYQTREAKMAGCLQFIKYNKPDICIAWFDETFEQYNHLLNTENLLGIEIKMAKALFPYSLETKNVVFLEHYPLFSKEDNLLAGKKSGNVWFFSSFDDAVLKVFGSNISSVMKRMGMAEDECIEHPMISKSIINAQKKMESKSRYDFQAKSGDEWILQFEKSKEKTYKF
jgi:hypothetical protein